MTDAPDDTLQTRIGYLVPLNKLPGERQARLLDHSDIIDLKKKEVLFRQGDRDDFTFYVLEGELEMYADDSLIKRVSGGEGASFQPLAQLQPRQMTAIAKSKAKVLRIKRSLLEQLLSMDDAPAAKTVVDGLEVEEMESAQSTDWLMRLLQSELFTRIPPSNIQGLLDTLENISFKQGEDVVRQGEPGDYYYVVQSGSCEVVRAGANRRPIRLAELEPGDTFGEEALISGARRNATVRMTSDGELARLTKADFTRLIKAPLLNVVSRAEAEAAIAAGARWLDVRFEDEHGHNGLPGSLNIPLSTLRTRMDELDAEQRYVVYCDTGGRSSAAAFLLAEKGFEVCYVEGGAVSDPAANAVQAQSAAVAAPSATPAAGTPPPPPPPTTPAPAPATPTATAASQELMLEAAVRASSLGAEVEKASLTIAQAQRMMAEAEAMKAEAERIVAQKLAREREALAEEQAALARRVAEAAAVEKQLSAMREAAAAAARMQQTEIVEQAAALQRAAETRIAAQQEKVERDAELLEQRLAEAARLKEALDQQQRQAQAARELADAERQRLREAAEREHAELEARTEALTRATQERLGEQQARIEREAEALRSKLGEAEKLKQTLLAQQQQAAAEAALHHDEVEERLQALEQEARGRLKQEEARLEALYNKQAEQLESLQAGREAELREQLRRELAAERANFEQAVTQTNAELERARDERAAALAAKEAASAEAARMIAEFKAAQQKLLSEQQIAFNQERERLRAEAASIEQLREEATRARREAEAAKAAAEAELAAARARQVSAAAPAAAMDLDIIAIEERASAADQELAQALAAETAAASAARQNEDALERTYDTANEINMLLQNELDQWVDEQDRMQESTLQRAILSRQKEMVERIRARAAAAKTQSLQHDRSLIDEIQAQLGD